MTQKSDCHEVPDSRVREVDLNFMKETSKALINRQQIYRDMMEHNVQRATNTLLNIVYKKIKASQLGWESTIDILLIRNDQQFFPYADIETVIGILRYEKQFEAFIRLSHAFSCICCNYDPPCCRWLTVKNTWTFCDEKNQ